MGKARCVVGVFEHSGWAVTVTADARATLLDRRRIELLDEGVPCMPYHHDAQGLPEKQAIQLVERVQTSAQKNAALALEGIAGAISADISAIALRVCPKLPPTIMERINDYWAQNRADWVMYRQALARAAQARGWKVHWYEAKTVIDQARAVFATDLDAHFQNIKRTHGAPWQKDHRVAMAAAIVASI